MRTLRPRALLLPWQRGALAVLGIGLWLSGGVWLLVHYLPHAPGAFGATRHPLEWWALAAHGACAVAGTWMLGVLSAIHVPLGWSVRRRRISGGVLVGVAAWLVGSGYLLYYLGDERLRASTSLLHWTIGVASPLVFVAHRLRVGRRRHASAWQRVLRTRRSA